MTESDDKPIKKARKTSAKEDAVLKKQGTWEEMNDTWLPNLKVVMKREGADGFVYTRMYDNNDIVRVGGSDDEDDEDDDDDNNLFTLEGLQKMRFVISTKGREAALDAGRDFASAGQGDDSVMMFNTSTGNAVIEMMPGEIKKAMKGADKKKHFDRLFGLTFALRKIEFWLEDNECWGDGNELDENLKLLGKTWKKLMKNSNEALGIDAEYSRPGVEALLEDFEEFVGENESGNYTFPWK